MPTNVVYLLVTKVQDELVGEVLRADIMTGIMQVPAPQGIKLHLPNTEGKSGGTISSVAHVAATEENIFSVLLCPRTQMASRKSCDCLGIYEEVN